jgi:phospholipid/cholesterol/gamma-HCH transport system substrate-binding protein
LLIVVAGLVLAGFIFVLGSFSLGEGYRLYVDFNFSGNLQPGAPVKVSGIKVGKVQDVQFLGGKLDEKSGRRVQVRAVVWVEERVKDAIRADAEFFVNTQGVLGEQYLEIAPGTHEKPPLGEEQTVVGHDPPRTDLIVARLYEFLDSTTKLLHDDKDLIRDLLKNSASAVSELNLLLVDNRKQIGELIGAGARFADQGASLLGEVRQAWVTRGSSPHGRRPRRDAGRRPRLARAAHPARVAPHGRRRPRNRAAHRGAARPTMVAVDSAGALMTRSLGLVDGLNAILTDLRAGKGTAGRAAGPRGALRRHQGDGARPQASSLEVPVEEYDRGSAMDEERLSVRVGGVVLVLIVLAAVLLCLVQGRHLRPGVRIEVDMSRIGNLQVGAAVTLAGLTLGSVDDIRLVPAPGGTSDARLSVWLDRRHAHLARETTDFFVNQEGSSASPTWLAERSGRAGRAARRRGARARRGATRDRQAARRLVPEPPGHHPAPPRRHARGDDLGKALDELEVNLAGLDR